MDRPVAVRHTGVPVLSEDLVELLPAWVKNVRGRSMGPSKTAIIALCKRCGLPPPDRADDLGKEALVRAIIADALDTEPAKAERFVERLVQQLRALGGFNPASDNYPGTESVKQLRAAFRRVGWDLMSDGTLLPIDFESLETALERRGYLRTYVLRARRGVDDPEVVIGTSKCLEEAVARQVLDELTDGYDQSTNIQQTLYLAFDRLGLASPATQQRLDPDPYREMQIAIQLLARAVARLRNDRGDGHGRPTPPVATALEGRLSALAAALIGELMLTVLEDQHPA